MLDATELALPIVPAVTADDATADLNHEVVEQLVVLFQDRVSQALALEERIHPAALHAWLREAITTVSPTWPRNVSAQPRRQSFRTTGLYGGGLHKVLDIS